MADIVLLVRELIFSGGRQLTLDGSGSMIFLVSRRGWVCDFGEGRVRVRNLDQPKRLGMGAPLGRTGWMALAGLGAFPLGGLCVVKRILLE